MFHAYKLLGRRRLYEFVYLFRLGGCGMIEKDSIRRHNPL